MGYIGPGAGFAFIGSFLLLLAGLALVLLAILSWPFRVVLALLVRRGKKREKTEIQRVIVVGLDGLDPRRTRSLMNEGRMPNMAKLNETGTFSELISTCPPISPVAWSSFMTGVNPGKHNIFDFLNRNLKTYAPELSSSRIETAARGKPSIKMLRKSKPFWNVLGEHGVFSTVLRVPITFPPEPFYGLSIAGMCVPDLRGTQGTFTYYTDSPDADSETTGGERIAVRFNGNRGVTRIPGPPAGKGRENSELSAPLLIKLDRSKRRAHLRISGQRVTVDEGSYTEWIRVEFKASRFRKVYGICRFYLVCAEPEFRLYLTPMNIDPERPAFPVSHPPYYSIYLAKLLGRFATLGLAEDTWALNEGVIDDDTFLEQVYSIHDERERMFFAALNKTRRGACVCVFDASDRIQHMFMRNHEKADDPEASRVYCDHVLDEMYVRMDDLVGRVMQKTGKRDVLMVLSDHGFTHFRRGVHLNVWLKENGYLHELGGQENEKYMRGIDWSRTRAYTFGLSGLYLNIAGRESGGIVKPDEVSELKKELTEKLLKITDPKSGRPAIRAVHESDTVYSGPYRNNGPDLVIGYEDGYRASWDAAVGATQGSVLSDNEKVWSGDHCVDQSLVPGIFFCNRKLENNGDLRLMDIGPTILRMFGVTPPSHMDGRSAILKKQTE
ncbi:MAG: alkaline phosphatase family protein [Verrucomicrobia bacterium]|nr:alkaline phosphatase family protein [Verrucomicrobiota bacterium]